MHRNVIFTFGFVVYFIVMALAMQGFGFGILSATVLLLAIPTYLLVHYSAAPRSMVVTISCFAIGMSLLLESLAHLYGLWVLVSEAGATFPGGLTFEIIIVTSFKILFLVLFYELLFDDGEYSAAKGRNRFVEFGLFAVGAVILVSLFYFLYDSFSSPTMYYWLILILLASSVAMLTVNQVLTTSLFKKIAIFSVVAAIPMLCVEYLLLGTGHKVLGNVLHPVSLPFFATPIPLAELLMAFAMPAFVTTIYELYLDDRS